MTRSLDDAPAQDAADPNPRRRWLALLSRAPTEMLEAALGPQAQAAVQWLRPPETGLMMVEGRAGGSGERFNFGEVTVTRCALRLDLAGAASATATVGVAYVLGRSHRKAQLAAMADALLQDPSRQSALEAGLLAPVRRQLERSQADRHARARSTRVEFFTVAREADGSQELGE